MRPRAPSDRFRHQIGGAADRDQVGGAVLADRLDRDRPALGLADHREQAGLRQHQFRELVHARRGRRAGGADDFVAHRIDRTDVVDHAAAEIDARRQASPGVSRSAMRLCAASRPVSICPDSSSVSPGFQLAHFLARQRVEIHAPRIARAVFQCTSGQSSRSGGSSDGRSAAVERRNAHGAVAAQLRDHRDRLRRGVGRKVLILTSSTVGEPAEALRADAERVDLLVELDAQLLELRSTARARAVRACRSASISDSLASTIAFSAVPPMPMPSIPGGHQPAPISGTVSSTQSTIESRRIQHRRTWTCSRSRRLWRRPSTSTVLPGTISTCTTAGVLSPVFFRVNSGIGDDRGAQPVLGSEVGAPHALVDELLASACARPSGSPCPP